MTKINENRFYDTLEDIFVGAKIEGDSGYINLLKIKEKYYSKVIEKFKNEINNNKFITESFKEEFFDKLYSFFDKYFSESGSVYFVKSANWQKVYEKVYSDNMDVVLFWKTNMLYYVKSDILFNNMEIHVKNENTDEDIKFHFNVGNLENKQNNEKKELVFEFDGITKNNQEKLEETYNINVQYSVRGRTTKIAEIVKETNIPEQTILKAIEVFKKQSEIDFFINKNAEVFLTEQLEIYLHQILLETKNKFDQNRLDQIKTIKDYSIKIIKFISQFENELVRIWNKPKFVLDGNYVITIDKISDKNLEKILKHKNMHEQINEWIKFGFLKTDDVITISELKESGKLPIDTKYFKDIEWEILSDFDNIEKALDGRLILSENYQALNTIKQKYSKKISSIYIDPPFNTGKDFEYVDNYQDSSWLSIMNDRLNLSSELLKTNGSLWLHLDENANIYGKELIKDKFSEITEIIFDTNATKDPEADLFGYKSFGDNFQLKHQTIYYARNENDYIFNKLWKPNRNTTKLDIGWLDLIAEPKFPKARKIADYSFYINKWENNKLIKEYIDVSNEKVFPVGDIWNDIFSFMQSEMRVSESFSFTSSQKPENLLRRIIQSSTNEGDIVLDFFLGIGTTIAVAHKLNRKWVGIEMGEHYGNWYSSKDGEKLGVLGRMKYVLYNDQTITKLNRRPHLSKNMNWEGGGFFKYYSLEQYEDTLSNMKYSQEQSDIFNTKNPFEEYIFFSDNKLTNIMEVEKNNIKLDFENLYHNIDWPETLSNLTGLPIKKITSTSVFLGNEKSSREISFNFQSMNNDEKLEFVKLIKPLIWWGD